jgi:hypothetical protein
MGRKLSLITSNMNHIALLKLGAKPVDLTKAFKDG